MPSATAIASGIRDALLAEWSFRVSIETEHVDVARFPSPEIEESRLRKVYASKYGNQRFDVIVISSFARATRCGREPRSSSAEWTSTACAT